MIDEKRLEQALVYLATTDDPCADLRADMARTEFKAKSVKAAIFKLAEGSVGLREATAETAPETVAAYEAHFKAMHAYHAMTNKRATEVIVIDTWRSMNASRRMGSIS
jgi:hypothetical protein